MNAPALFSPPRRNGVLFQAGAGLALLALCGACLWQATREPTEPGFLALLLLAVVFFIPTPLVIYRLYALLNARYSLERDGIRIHWGMRYEDVPLPEVEWVRPASDLAALVPDQGKRRPWPTPRGGVPLPWLSWPGALLGSRQVEGLGTIEFLASTTGELLLVATTRRIYAISPADPAAFLRSFGRINELGSLSPLPQRSIYPASFLSRIWSDRLAAALLLAGLGLSLALLVWVVLTIPARASISLGFSPDGTPFEPSASERLLLLPVLNTLAYLVDLVGGLYFFRRQALLPVAYVLWAAGVLSPLIMMVGVAYIIKG